MLRPNHVRGTLTALTPRMRHLSPAFGLALSGSPFLGRIYDLEPPEADVAHFAVSKLTRQLFHRNHRDEPLFPTTNKSLAAAHLSASLTAHVAGIASVGLVGEAAHAQLCRAQCSDTGLTLSQLARTTGVTIARFARLVEHVRHADDPMVAEVLGVKHLGSALLMHHHWLRSSTQGKGALWTYLKTLHEYYGPALSEDMLPTFERDANLFIASESAQRDLAPAAVLRAAKCLLQGNRSCRESTELAAAAATPAVLAAVAVPPPPPL